MYDDVSCSDCKLEIIEKKWTQVLVNWLNKCVLKNKIHHLNYWCLLEVAKKYRHDCDMGYSDEETPSLKDLEPFIENQYPLLRLRNLCEVNNFPKKVYIMTSVLLYLCCMRTKYGQVDVDICDKLPEENQEMILKFCENLNKMEVTIYNVESAAKAAVSSIEETRDARDFDTDDNSIETSLRINASDSSDYITRTPSLQFQSSITILPSNNEDTTSKSTLAELSEVVFVEPNVNMLSSDNPVFRSQIDNRMRFQELSDITHATMDSNLLASNLRCQENCSCLKSNPCGMCCGDPCCSNVLCKKSFKSDVSIKDNRPFYKYGYTCSMACYAKKLTKKRPITGWRLKIIIATLITLALAIILATIPFWKGSKKKDETISLSPMMEVGRSGAVEWFWECKKNMCHKVLYPKTTFVYSSYGRCALLCMGPQIWPYPIGTKHFCKQVISLTTRKLKYKFKLPSDLVQEYMAAAFGDFLKNLMQLESNVKLNVTKNFIMKTMNILINIESDSDPKLRLNTDESYSLNIENAKDDVMIKINAISFCGARHALETLSQIIVLDEISGYLITLSNAHVEDSPSYNYRGLMIDTGRNFIPVNDIIRTLDGMAMCKLNTLHWRISDVASFPLHLPDFKEINEYGPYDKSMVYRKNDIMNIVKKAGFQGIRVLIEIAVPGPTGRPWSMILKDESSTVNKTNNILCMRLKMQDSTFDVLQKFYSLIIQMTKVEDVFHLSDSIFSLTNCYDLVTDRAGFLDKALVRLKFANKGFLPKLPIIWYTTHLKSDLEAKNWDRQGVQVYQAGLMNDLSKYKVIHSTKWDLSCEMRQEKCVKYRTWQEMYAWVSWRNKPVFSTEGGEAMLWTDIVDSGNLDSHVWPRAAAVAERLWSAIVVNNTADATVYMRLEVHRWRMVLRGVNARPVWSARCSFNPTSCFSNKMKVL